jgi:hypothetical protein
MSMTGEKEYAHIGETRGMQDHDHDLIHDLSRRLDCLWRYDQYIANADGQTELLAFWRNAKTQEQQNIDQLKQLIKQHVESNCF